MKKAKVVLVQTGSGFGGAEIHTGMLAEHFVQSGFEVTVVGHPATLPDLMQQRLQACGAKFDFLNMDAYRGQQSFPLLGEHFQHKTFETYLSRNSFDIVIVAAPWPDMCLGAASAARAAGIPCINIFHLYDTKLQMSDAFGAGIRRLYEAGQTFICVGYSNTRALEKESGLPKGSIRFIPNGTFVPDYMKSVDTEEYKATRKRIRSELLIPDDVKLVVNSARIHPQKGFETFAAIASNLLQDQQNLHFLWVGGGDREAIFRNELMQRDIASDVTVTGWVDNPLDYLCAADIFLQTSRYEGASLSLALLEALQMHIPTVAMAAEAYGAIEVGKHLMISSDPTAAEEAVRGLLQSEEAAQSMRQNLKDISDQFTSKRMGDCYVDVIQGIQTERAPKIDSAKQPPPPWQPTIFVIRRSTDLIDLAQQFDAENKDLSDHAILCPEIFADLAREIFASHAPAIHYFSHAGFASTLQKIIQTPRPKALNGIIIGSAKEFTPDGASSADNTLIVSPAIANGIEQLDLLKNPGRMAELIPIFESGQINFFAQKLQTLLAAVAHSEISSAEALITSMLVRAGTVTIIHRPSSKQNKRPVAEKSRITERGNLLRSALSGIEHLTPGMQSSYIESCTLFWLSQKDALAITALHGQQPADLVNLAALQARFNLPVDSPQNGWLQGKPFQDGEIWEKVLTAKSNFDMLALQRWESQLQVSKKQLENDKPWFFIHCRRVPYPITNGSDSRMITVACALREFGYRVLLLCEAKHSQRAEAKRKAFDLSKETGLEIDLVVLNEDESRIPTAPIKGVPNWNAFVHQSVAFRVMRLIDVMRPVAIWVNYVHHTYVGAIAKARGVKFIIDTHDRATMREAMIHRLISEFGEDLRKCTSPALFDMRTYLYDGGHDSYVEESLLDAADEVIAISQRDFDYFSSRESNRGFYLPMPAEPVAVPKGGNLNLFIGTDNFANRLAATYIFSELIPKVRETYPDFTVTFVGTICSYVPNGPGVVKLNLVADLTSLYHQANLVLAPMFYVSGQNIKIVEAMSFGIPVVAFKNVLGRCHIRHNISGYLAKDKNDFVTGVQMLLGDTELRNSMSEEALRDVAFHHSDARTSMLIAQLLKKVGLRNE